MGKVQVAAGSVFSHLNKSLRKVMDVKPMWHCPWDQSSFKRCGLIHLLVTGSDGGITGWNSLACVRQKVRLGITVVPLSFMVSLKENVWQEMICNALPSVPSSASQTCLAAAVACLSLFSFHYWAAALKEFWISLFSSSFEHYSEMHIVKILYNINRQVWERDFCLFVCLVKYYSLANFFPLPKKLLG